MSDIPKKYENTEILTLNSVLDLIELGLPRTQYNSFTHFFSKCDLEGKIIINKKLKIYSDFEQIEELSRILAEEAVLRVSTNNIRSLSQDKIINIENIAEISDLDGIDLTLEREKGALATYSLLVSNKNSYIEGIKKISVSVFAGFLLSSGISFNTESKNEQIKNFDIPSTTNSFMLFQNQKIDFMLNSLQKELVRHGGEAKRALSIIKSLDNDEVIALIDFLDSKKLFIDKEEKQIHIYENMINGFYTGINIKNANKIARQVHKYSKEKNIPAEYVLAILKKESDFNQGAYNPSGDFSIAQINYKIWNKEYEKKTKKKLDLVKLKASSDYAIDVMTDILLMHKKYEDTDPLWYARYHSKTKSRKEEYANKLNEFVSQMSKYDISKTIDKINQISKEIANLSNINEEKVGDFKHAVASINNNYDNLTIHRYVANISDYE